jgi:hypothetical protein
VSAGVCRACGASPLDPVLDLGSTPLANALVAPARAGKPEPTYPLLLCFCSSCALVQIAETVDPAVLFSDYPYFSSFSATTVRRAAALARRLVAEERLGPDSLVVELASNDGYLLQHYLRAGVRVLGVEPAENVAAAARERGVTTRSVFFGEGVAEEMAREGLRADVIHAHNVLAHVPDLPGFTRGVARLLSEGGTFVVEAPHVLSLVDHVEFDTIYHEHFSYFSLISMSRLFEASGLRVTDVEPISSHGGSLRVLARRSDGSPRVSPAVGDMLRREQAWGAHGVEPYRRLVRGLATCRERLLRTLEGLAARGRTLAAYGASAKGATLLNVFGLDASIVPFVVDRNPRKQGYLMPGAKIPILPADALLERMPDATLLLAWNFEDEIVREQQAYLARGGTFVVPIPSARVVGGARASRDSTMPAPGAA